MIIGFILGVICTLIIESVFFVIYINHKEDDRDKEMMG